MKILNKNTKIDYLINFDKNIKNLKSAEFIIKKIFLNIENI